MQKRGEREREIEKTGRTGGKRLNGGKK